MFGTNAIKRPSDYPPRLPDEEQPYLVQEVFATIQGEGPLTGMPAVFVRLWGCNLRCHFCDTDFESNCQQLSTSALVEQVDAARGKANLVVITGGEPLLQQVGFLCHYLVVGLGMSVQFETAGTVWPSSFEDPVLQVMLDQGAITFVCSPKTPAVHPAIERYCRDWKYIISARGELSEVDGLPESSTQRHGTPSHLYRPDPAFAGTIWVQPCHEYAVWYEYSRPLGRSVLTQADAAPMSSRESIDLTVDIAKRFGYRVSLQTHKVLRVP